MKAAILRHIRFWSALLCGLAAYFAAHLAGLDGAALAGGDIFYLVFLCLMAPLVRQAPADLKARARDDDEGIAVVVLVTLATIIFSCEAVFVTLNGKHGAQLAPLLLALAGVPLGWLMLQTILAFHYADLHYFDDPDCQDDEGDLLFPGKGDPGPWDFLYFSFVVAMTAQVSDVQVLTTTMRRIVLWHGVISFFFNTVIIAMAVNAAVTLAS